MNLRHISWRSSACQILLKLRLGRNTQILIYNLLIRVILFIAISLSAKYYGERLVANILVEASSKQPYE